MRLSSNISPKVLPARSSWLEAYKKILLIFLFLFVELKNNVFLQPQFMVGVVAQLVEQRTENPCVAGSIPADATKKGGLSRLFC